MIVRLLSILCFGVLVASAHDVEGNNDNEGNARVAYRADLFYLFRRF